MYIDESFDRLDLVTIIDLFIMEFKFDSQSELIFCWRCLIFEVAL